MRAFSYRKLYKNYTPNRVMCQPFFDLTDSKTSWFCVVDRETFHTTLNYYYGQPSTLDACAF